MNDLVQSPFGRPSAAVAETAGTKQVMHREMAEMQIKFMMAQQFKRDMVKCTDNILNSFTRQTLAEQSEYQYSKGGSEIRGASIRAAEAIAQQWENFEFGFNEISRGIGPNGIPFSEVESFARDLEKRTQKPLKFIVPHWRDTKKGGYQLKDEREIYELMANQAQRRTRSCILALIPGDVVDAALKQAALTLKTTADTSPEATARMLEKFKEFGVTKEMIEKRIQRRIDSIQPAQIVSLRRIYTSLIDEMSEASDWFEMGETGQVQPDEKPKAPSALPICTTEQFDKRKDGYRQQILGGMSVKELIGTIETKFTLTEEQKMTLDSYFHEND